MLTDPYSVETTALKCKKVLSVLKATWLKRVLKNTILFLLYRNVMLCVTGYGLGLTLMTQTTRLKLDRVQNEPMRVILGTIKDTLTETTKFMLASHQCKSRQKAEHVKAYFNALELYCLGKWLFRTGFWKVLSGWLYYSPLNQSFRSVLSSFPIRVALLYTLSFTQHAIAASSNAVSTRPL